HSRPCPVADQSVPEDPTVYSVQARIRTWLAERGRVHRGDRAALKGKLPKLVPDRDLHVICTGTPIRPKAPRRLRRWRMQREHAFQCFGVADQATRNRMTQHL